MKRLLLCAAAAIAMLAPTATAASAGTIGDVLNSIAGNCYGNQYNNPYGAPAVGNGLLGSLIGGIGGNGLVDPLAAYPAMGQYDYLNGYPGYNPAIGAQYGPVPYGVDPYYSQLPGVNTPYLPAYASSGQFAAGGCQPNFRRSCPSRKAHKHKHHRNYRY